MLKIALLADFGVNKGGGDFVLLNMLEALSIDFDVTLITSTPSGFYEASKLFNKKIGGIRIRKIRLLPFSKHPYTIAYMAKKISKDYTYDLIVVSDDIPRCLSDRKVISYVHFPHAIRIAFNEHVMQKYKKSFSGRIMWFIHRRLFNKYYFLQNIANNKWFFIINSQFTMKNMKDFMNLNLKNITLLNPPVESLNLNNVFIDRQLKKEDLILSIGWFEPVKGTLDTIRAFSMLPNKGQYTLRLIGFAGNSDYISEIKEAINNSGCPQNIELILNGARSLIIENLLRAKIIVHSALREHFGIVVVEGMATRCIPVVRKGFNGPWKEITEEGKYGLGFETVTECSLAIEKGLSSYTRFSLNKISSKALEFDEQLFQKKFKEIVLDFFVQNI